MLSNDRTMDSDGAGIYIAPLKINKIRDSPQNLSANDGENQYQAPNMTDTGFSFVDSAPPPPTDQSLLRAIYPFTPTSNLSPNTITLPITTGDLILVHSVHTNGWADGTLLRTGERGWMPTNYCQVFEQARLRPLLKSLTEFWDLIRTGNATAESFQSQDYLRGLIAGVRFLLERSDCLTRDSPLVKTYDDLRRSRKSLLSDLSLFVKTGKQLQSSLDPSQRNAPDQLLDELLLRAFSVITKSAYFLDLWNDNLQRAVATDDDIHYGSPATSKSETHSVDSQPTLPEGIHALESSIQPQTVSASSRSNTTSLRITQSLKAIDRANVLGLTSSAPLNDSVSDHLTERYDAFLGILASFLGSHLQSRSSSELLLTAQHAVRSCRELLQVIENVLEHDSQAIPSIYEAKDTLCEKLTDLVEAAKNVFHHDQLEGEDHAFRPEKGKDLLNAATACVRVAGDCVAKTRSVLVTGREPDLERPTTAPYLEPSTTPSHTDEARTVTNSSSPRGLGITDYFSRPATVHISTLETSGPRPGVESFFNGEKATSPEMSRDAPSSPDRSDGLSAQTQRHRSMARTIVISSGSNSTYVSSHKDSDADAVSASSTRATSPESSPARLHSSNSQGTLSSKSRIDDLAETEAVLLEKTYAHELMFNKEGHVVGGSLPALIERLTTYDSTPDPTFTSTFYLTFRLFVAPAEIVAALADRFNYVAETAHVAGPVRLRVYNVFKSWLESHWRHDCDAIALPDIVRFARDQLIPVLPGPGNRLVELTEKVATASSPLVSRVVTAIGKTNTSLASYYSPDSPAAPPIISRGQLVALRTWKMGGSGVNIIDFDALELARQITLKVSAPFCSILPEELLATEWQKRSGSLAVNVNALSKLSTDLTNLVSDSILQLEEPKKRAVTIKQWVKVAARCLELNNFDTLMAIIAALKSATIQRMKKTWEVVSQKTRTSLEELTEVLDVSRNRAALRQRLQVSSPPCIPFLGMYLTDLTFVDDGNPMTRQLSTEDGSLTLINFDKHMKTARIISDLQRFQVPYRFTEVPELQIWMQDQLIRVRSLGEASFQNQYRRSLLLEPRELSPGLRNSTIDGGGPQKDKFDLRAWTHLMSKEKQIASQG